MSSNNTKVVKNTLILYLRMLLVVFVGLYTSRLVLNILGVNDFGIYNVVGGIVMMFSAINAGMVTASQRFISYELGSQNIIRLKKIFSVSITIHLFLALIIFILGETIGLWFLNTMLNIPPERMYAANWVFQCSIFTFILSVISVPYSACIVAHEHMKVYAYISITELFLRLIIIMSIPLWSFDKLIVYSIAILFIAIIIRFIYGIYCNLHFEECKFKFTNDKKLFLEMFSFAGWSFIGNLGFTAKDQGINILINIFFGVATNSARAIAYQVSSVISGFISNFQMALNPQIIKRYAMGEIDSMLQLVFSGSKYSFFLLMIIVIPLYLRSPYILQLWLGNGIPEHTVIFLRLVLIMLLIDSMTGPLVTAMQATGKIRNFQLTISLIMLANLPFSYLVLMIDSKPSSVMYIAIATSIIGLVARLKLLNILIPFSLTFLIKKLLLKNFIILVLVTAICHYTTSQIDNTFYGLLIVCIITTAISLLAIYFIGFEKWEQAFIWKHINLIFKNMYAKIN